MRSMRLLTALLLGLTGLVAVGATTRSAEAISGDPNNKVVALPAKPIKNEQTLVFGGLTTQVSRPVVLQRKAGTTWRTVTTGTANSTGKWYFDVTASVTRTYRIHAPKHRIGSKTYKAISGPSKKVTIVPQRTTLHVTPDEVCAESSTANTVYATVQLSPVRTGRRVDIAASETAELKTGYSDGQGRVTIPFTVPQGATHFRATTYAKDGAAQHESSVYTVELYLFCSIA